MAKRQADLDPAFQDLEKVYPNIGIDSYPNLLRSPLEQSTRHALTLDSDPTFVTGWGAGNIVADPTRRSAAEDLTAPPDPLGDFRLGYNIVVAKNAQPVGPSRQATPAEWEAVLKDEIGKRTGRYQGEKLYHLGVGVDAYALAYPGIPLVLNPKSILHVTVNVWDDTAGRKINAEPKTFTVFEPFSAETMVGTGLTRSKEQQMAALAGNAARQINDWLVQNKAWFSPEALAAQMILGRDPNAPATAQASAQAAAPAAVQAGSVPGN